MNNRFFIFILIALHVSYYSCSRKRSKVTELQHKLEVAIDSVQLNPTDYYGYNLRILYQDYELIRKRLYMLYYFDKDSTKRFYTGYWMDEKKRTIILGPDIDASDTETEVAAIFEKDEHMRAILLQLLQFRRIAGIGTITSLHGWFDRPQNTQEEDMWFVFWYKRNCYQLTHYNDHKFLSTDTIVHGDWQLRKVEPLPW